MKQHGELEQTCNNEQSNKKIHPTTLKKFSKCFDGMGDPYKHIAQYHQLIYVEGDSNMHTKMQGFGLTLEEGSSLSWFQKQKSSMLYDFEVFIKHVIDTHSKIGIKHNTLTYILNFKQEEGETMKSYIERLKKYMK